MDEVHKTLAEILSSEEYQTAIPTRDLRDSLWTWIGARIKELFEAIGNLGHAAPAVLWLILLACAIVLAVIFIHGAIVLSRALRASRTGRVALIPGGPSPTDDAGQLLDRAGQAAAAGRFTEAIRLCHRSALMGLDRRGLVRFQECLTSGDYKSQLCSHLADRALFAALTDIYEPACFGNLPVTGTEYARSRTLTLRLQTGATS